MTISLSKGARINLSKEVPSLKSVRFELKWKPNDTDTGHEFDLDGTVFGLKADGEKQKLVSEQWMVFYNNPEAPNKAVVHDGDNKVGGGGGEKVIVNLESVPAEVEEFSFVVTIHEAVSRKQNFGQVDGSSIAAYDNETGKEIARYDLGDDFSSETAVQFASLYRKDGNWLMKAVGQGYNSGLADFVRKYGFDAS